ncbi:MAG: lysine--tRNA ligase [Oscillospiraceae bacterium]|jgi:lysyl-tRNA synthetase class 2|nr:lysine--tRNA ligase [Oscillospiraceae bacterium]
MTTPEQTTTENTQPLSELLQIRRDKLTALQDAGQNPYEITTFARTHFSAQVKADFDALENSDVSVCGRIMAKRGMGKAIFADIADDRGRIQIYVRRDDVGEEAFDGFKKWDIGDFAGFSGFVFKTKMGEISVHAKTVTLLSKSLRPLPEKHHGLTDVETKYRKRYLDLIMDEDSRRVFEIRSKYVSHLRAFLDSRGFLEVDTPVLNTISGGASARPFVTHHNAQGIDMYLRIATELHLKRLIVGGIERVYEVGRIFRNEGMDTKHNPEFTTVEWYQAYADYNVIMDEFRELLSSAAKSILGTYTIEWLGHEIDLAPENWRSITMTDAVKQYAGIDFTAFSDTESSLAAAKAAGVVLDKTQEPSWGRLLYECFDVLVEGQLVQPTFITEYPVEVSPLAKRKPGDARVTERFECFVAGCEMSNGFSELNDPIDQRGRFEAQLRARERGDEEAEMLDEDFLEALEYGMPPTGGIGSGVDRCAMLLAGASSIRDVLFFPTMKPIQGQ